MTIDERLEALTMNVELIAGMQKDSITQHDKISEDIRLLAAIVRSHDSGD